MASVRQCEALCIAALGGNGHVDVENAASSVERIVAESKKAFFPYIQGKDKADSPGNGEETDRYAEYFDILKEMDAEMKGNDSDRT